MPRARLTRKLSFAAAHRYHRPEWSEAENRRVFGPSASPHGHNYLLEVTVEGEIDPVTGFCVDLSMLERLLEGRVRCTLDHRDINGLPEFGPGAGVPTSENVLVYLWPRIAGELPASVRLVRLRLHESDDFYVDYSGDTPPGP